MKIRILTASDIKSALPMPRAIEAMRLAFGQLSAGLATMPLRGRLPTDKGITLLMSAFLHETQDMGVKIVSIYPDNPNMGLPTVSGTLLVIDPQTGMPKAFMEADSLTALRTGAAGGLAAEILSRKDSETAALFGTGIQGKAQLQAVMAVRSITRVHLFDPSESSARRLSDEIAAWKESVSVNLASTPREAVRDADIVITATTSPTPVFNGNDLRPGAHVTAVGSFSPDIREVDDTTVQRATIVVDSREACLAEAGDIIIPGVQIDAELGEIVNRTKPGRQSDDEITFFKTVGVAVQDAVSAAAVLAEAEENDRGTVINL
ncbi:hypothetical protein QUF80_22485 [Desulfococcaceae bacterium HSG8]|nr:hypothetical protein [Desulfococcaceae bacterium HSG8]